VSSIRHERGTGVIVLDNMTLQGAVRALSPVEPDLRDSWSEHHRVLGKKDYSAADDLRRVADVLALAQLVQAVVLHDGIGIGPYGTPAWAEPSEGGPEVPGELDGVAGLLTFLADGYDHAGLAIETLRYAQDLARTDAFRGYVRALEEHHAVGAYLEISNGYYCTGFSDELLCGDSAHQSAYEVAAGIRDIGRHVLYRIEARLARWHSPRRTRRLMERLGDVADHEYRMPAEKDFAVFPFDLARVAGKDVHDRAIAGIDLIRNIAAACYYDRLAACADAAYAPHPLRAPFVEYRAPATGLDPRAVIRRMDLRRAGHVEAARRRIDGAFPGGGRVAEVRLPLFLAAVLAESADPEDVLPRALELRDSRPARRLRTWFAETGELARTGDLGIDELATRARDLEKALDAGWRPEPENRRKITIGLTVGPATVQAQDVWLPSLRLRRVRAFRLLYDLAQLSRASLGLGPDLGRVLGPGVEEAWQRHGGVLAGIETPVSRPS
jgi:hypothetical protein